MRSVDLVVETRLDRTPRVKQLSGMFDVPAQEKLTHHWKGDLPIDERDWNIGLIVGPSGAGKSSVARQLFGETPALQWLSKSVIDDFGKSYSIEDIAGICSSVGFNTIPSWMKPFGVLSTGEKFRVELARHLLEGGELVMIDEFTSVVDRQVAKIGSHAVQKHVRKRGTKFVAVTCHYDVIDWLQPDWVLEPATMTFQWRAVQRRPSLNVEISRVDYSAWKLFAPFHYLSADLHRGARCFVLFVDNVPASFIAILHMPHAIRGKIFYISRAVTLPDYQGMGLVMALESKICGAYRTFGINLRGYPAHPSHIRSLDRSQEWRLIRKPGKFTATVTKKKTSSSTIRESSPFGGRPCAVFEFCGQPLDEETAQALLDMSQDEVRRLNVV